MACRSNVPSNSISFAELVSRRILAKSRRPLHGLTLLWGLVPGFAALTPGFMPPFASRTC